LITGAANDRFRRILLKNSSSGPAQSVSGSAPGNPERWELVISTAYRHRVGRRVYWGSSESWHTDFFNKIGAEETMHAQAAMTVCHRRMDLRARTKRQILSN
jgi:hypothetical protein